MTIKTSGLRQCFMCFIWISFMLISRPVPAQQSLQSQVDWPDFMRTSDLVYDTLTTQWTDGLFTGNGLLGSTIYMKDPATLRIDVGNTRVRDHRRDTGLGPLFNQARLPIGYFTLKPTGKPTALLARLDLWNAVAKGKIITEKGRIYWRSWAQANQNVLIFQLATTGAENQMQWSFHPDKAQSPRLAFHPELKSKYKANPAPFTYATKAQGYCMQPLSAGGGYTTAWQALLQTPVRQSSDPLGGFAADPYFEDDLALRASEKMTFKTYVISIATHSDNLSSSKDLAKENIRQALSTGLNALYQQHIAWWHHYYTKSFISLPDPVLNSFYWIQLYKLAAASRKDKPLIDLMGPWMARTPWPGNWWNLNTQLTYSPLYTAGHLGIASQLGRMLSKNAAQLSKNVPRQFRYNSAALGRAGAPDMDAPLKVTGHKSDLSNPQSEMELGDLTWLLYYYWLQYRYTMDTAVLSKLYPLLRSNINYYLHLAKKGPDGAYHLPYSYSPEYPGGMTRDANYALALFRWGCQTLLQANKLLGKNDPLVPKWQTILKELTAYPTDKNGLMIGRDVPFAKSHRHYSHLLMIYPLHLMSWADTAARPLILKSLQHWHSLPGALQGYSFTGGASIYALMGAGQKALSYLKTLIDQYVKPNTMYTESGPVIETPLAAATTLQELLLQSYNDRILVFPAVPKQWSAVSFDHLRTQGAFIVSGVYQGHKTRWVRVQATRDGVCTIQPGFHTKEPVQWRLLHAGPGRKNRVSHLVKQPQGPDQPTYQIKLFQGDQIVLFTNRQDLSIPLKAVPFEANGRQNYFGKKRP